MAHTVLDRLQQVYPAVADPQRAAAMAAYMRHQFPFLGIPAPVQRRLAREVLAGQPRPAEDELRLIAQGCWALREREYQYFACLLLRRYAGACSAGFIGTAHELITTKSWWDTVDTLAAHLVGPLVARHPALVSTMDTWAVDENIWLARSAILHQLRYREDTDADRLFRYCTLRAAHPDFFVRKAIGWALREYARTDPAAVRGYVTAHQGKLSPLSVRGALRNLG